MTATLDQLAAADFETLPDRQLVLVNGEQRIVLDVVETRALPARIARSTPPFAVTLRHTGARASLLQGMFRYEHPVHGALDLFTVPVGPDGQGMCYEIIFN
jgi:hypothetical protein